MVSSGVISGFKPYKILAIDTSCDETSVAVISGFKVLSNSLFSQATKHAEYGGVVPDVARFLHAEKIGEITRIAIEKSGLNFTDLDAIAVTQGPGLAIALEVGIQFAKDLALKYGLPLVAVNHMEGHLLSGLANLELIQLEGIKFPILGVLVSGKHTEFILSPKWGVYSKLGATLDDAAGEAFDKAARMLELPYPGGPHISRLADEAREKIEIKFTRDQQKLHARGFQDGTLKYELPVPMAFSTDANMSYSGLKTAFKYLIKELSEGAPLSEETKAELCLMFESAALHSLVIKLQKVVSQTHPQELWLGGGVVASRRLRELVGDFAKENGLVIREPDAMNLMMDNAAMIGLAANLTLNLDLEDPRILRTEQEIDSLDRRPGLSL